jgi:hypothetical protein
MSIENALVSLIAQLEQDRSLDKPQHLRQRVAALDDLDAYPPDGQVIGQFIEQPIGTALHHRAKAIYDELESVNSTLYEAIRRDIQRGAGHGVAAPSFTPTAGDPFATGEFRSWSSLQALSINYFSFLFASLGGSLT